MLHIIFENAVLLLLCCYRHSGSSRRGKKFTDSYFEPSCPQ